MSSFFRRYNRRKFLGTGVTFGAGAAGLALVGCGSDDDDDEVDPTATTSGEAPSTATTEAPGTPKVGGTLRSAILTDITSLNAATQFSVNQGSALSLMYNNLVRRMPPTGEIGPDLADTWESSPDGLTHTFQLNPAVQWHNGGNVTAEDVKASYEYYLSKPSGVDARKHQALRNVETIDAISDTELSIKLSAPRATFLDFLGMAYEWIVPAQQLLSDITWFDTNVNGTGAFRLEEWKPDVEVSLVPNPDYFRDGLPYLERVRLQVVPDSVTRLALYEADELDMSWVTTYLSNQEYERLNEKSGWVVANQPSDIFTGFFMFGGHEPTNDPRVRKAINLILDRRAAIQVLGRGRGTLGGYFTPGSRWAMSEEELLKRPGFREDKNEDIAEAKAILEDAGYGDGLQIWSMLNTTSQPEVGRAIGQFCQDQLGRAGVELELRPMESTAMSKLRNEDGPWNVYVLESISRSGSDPDFASPHLARGNVFGLRDEKAFELFDKQSAILNPEERLTVVKELEEHLFDIVPYAPMYFAERAIAMSERVQGFTPTPDTYQFVPQIDRVWLA